MLLFTSVNKLMAFLERKIQLLPLNKVIVWSDGMRARFHSRFEFVLLSKFDLAKSCEWHWNTAHYGKGLVDGVGVSMKNFCCRAIKLEKYSKNTRRVYQCCGFTNTIINLFANNRLLREPPEEANAPPIPEKLQM